jgi:hypothetical protein
MGQDSAWGGHPEVYAVAWFYGVDISIHAQEYVNTGGFLVFKRDGSKNNSSNPVCMMWTPSYHGNNQYNSIHSPGNPSCPINYIMNIKQFWANLQSALDEYYNNVAQLVSSIDSIWKSTQSIISYIAGQLLDADGEVVLEDRMGNLCTQAKEPALEDCCVASTHAADSAPSPVNIS